MNYENYLSIGLDPLDMPGEYVLDEEVYGKFIRCVYKKRKKCNRLSESIVSPRVRLSEKDYPFLALAGVAARHKGEAEGIIFDASGIPERCRLLMAIVVKDTVGDPNFDTVFMEKRGFFSKIWKRTNYFAGEVRNLWEKLPLEEVAV